MHLFISRNICTYALKQVLLDIFTFSEALRYKVSILSFKDALVEPCSIGLTFPFNFKQGIELR